MAGQQLNNASASSVFNNNLARSQQRLGAAAQLSAQGAGIFNQGRMINNDLMGAGNTIQQQHQGVLDAANRGLLNFQNAPLSALTMPLSAVGGQPTPMNRTGTEACNPGLFDYLGLAAGAAGNMFSFGL